MKTKKTAHTIFNPTYFIYWLAIIIGGLFTGTTSYSETQKVITLAGGKGTKNSFYGRWLALIYNEAFNRLGYTLVYNGYPAKRASQLSDQGIVDGEIHRVADYANKHPNLVRVDEPHFSVYFSAYGIDPSIHLDGWESLKNNSYRVGYRRGVKKCETILPALLPPNRLMISESSLQGLEQVVAGRTQVFIDVQQNITFHLNQSEFQKVVFYRVGIMEKTPAHAFLHKKHKSLAPKLSLVLKKMKQEGLIEKYKAKAER
ncbi:hypothetical protein H0A36_14865 [Endozoicomonas sp. SM1973]|uniref:Solute-binding protein family 3/N-terminal domain-containing protein n=1 Tax=Spartinivicinus marinus TaxID=2994442 RepID=A0A853ICP5_9GAMM|nr:hypothetical protein [Spartinivicinus marinus]MCX4026357.1 hypothetical protein [Spartinivicinus marinus]NYZ67297.1 hypothetical protein [Spartinivicinus marinus]